MWDQGKSELLRSNPARGNVGFEECLLAIEENKVLDIIPNSSSNHPGQEMLVLEINGYAFCVPFVETEDQIFLKTLFPSRKHTAIYLTGSRQ